MNKSNVSYNQWQLMNKQWMVYKRTDDSTMNIHGYINIQHLHMITRYKP